MRTIPVATAALLKSRAMIGLDSPNHNIVITGAPIGGSLLDPTTWTTWRTFTGDSPARTDGNIAETEDGRAVAIYVEGGTDVKIAFASSVAEVLAGTATFDTAGATTLLSGLSCPQASIALIDGKLCAAIYYVDATPIGVCEFWQDSDGNGTGFAKASDISTNTGNLDGGSGISPIQVLPGGAWVVLVPYAYYVYDIVRCYYSTDDGATWTAGGNIGASLFNRLGGASPTILPLTDTSFVVAAWYSSGTSRWTHFTGNGATAANYEWTWDWDGSSSPGHASFIKIGDKYYMSRIGSADTVIVSEFDHDTPILSNFISSSDWTDLATITADNSSNCFFVLASEALILQHHQDTAGGLHRISGAGTVISNQRLKVKRIEVARNKGMASDLTLVLDNKNGRYSPDIVGNWHEVLFPGVELYVEQGYGADLVRTFSGTIDDVIMRHSPGNAELELQCRDGMKLLLDQTITAADGSHSITYTGQTIEYIVNDLATKAGLTSITTEATGITLSTFTTEWESYADAIQRLADMAGFEWYCDELNAFFFVYPTDRQPEQEDTLVLNGTTAVDLTEYPVVTASIRVYSGTGETGTLYALTTDYVIVEGDSESEWTIARVAGSTIPDDGAVYVTYVYCAWVFREGEDIVSLDYGISGRDLASTIITHGADADGNEIEATAAYTSAAYYNVLTDKIVKIDAPDADTEAKCQAIADRQELLMRTKARICQHVAIAVPWLQIGDTIMIIETTTGISEAYRILSMTPRQEAVEGGQTFLMDITTYHYGYSVAA